MRQAVSVPRAWKRGPLFKPRPTPRRARGPRFRTPTMPRLAEQPMDPALRELEGWPAAIVGDRRSRE